VRLRPRYRHLVYVAADQNLSVRQHVVLNNRDPARVAALVAEPFEDPHRGRPKPDPFTGIIDKILMEDEGRL
jgi:hypothetical protein